MSSSRPLSLVATVAAFTLALVPAVALAEIVTVPTALNPGDQYRLAFVTSTKHNAVSTDIAVYNSFVQAVAETQQALVDLGATWKVVASTSTLSARNNTGTQQPGLNDAPVFLLNDTQLATGNFHLWAAMSNLLNPLNITESGAILSGFARVYTGSDKNGSAAGASALGGGTVIVGNPNITGNTLGGPTWLFEGSSGSSTEWHFYAFSNVLTVPAMPVPEPELYAMMGFGLGLVGWIARRRREKSCEARA